MFELTGSSKNKSKEGGKVPMMWSDLAKGVKSIDKILRHYARLICSTKPIRLGSTVYQDFRQE